MSSGALPPPAAPPRRPRPIWRRSPVGLVSLAVSGVLLIFLYRSMDIRLIGEALRGADRVWLVISLGMIVPITVLRAIRFFRAAPAGALPNIGEALRLTLVASALNAFVPAKTGDLIKSYFVATRGGTSAGVGVAIIVYERLCDLFSLISWCLVGWLLSRPLDTGVPSAIWPLLGTIGAVCAILILSERAAGVWRTLATKALTHRKLRRLRDLAEGWPDLLQVLGARRGWLALFSLFLWLVHLTQMWMFTMALSVHIPFMVCASLSAIALMAGQVPFHGRRSRRPRRGACRVDGKLYDSRGGSGDGDTDCHSRSSAASGRLADHAALPRGRRKKGESVANGNGPGRMRLQPLKDEAAPIFPSRLRRHEMSASRAGRLWGP